MPSHWGVVRCGCVEGVLATAILAGQHADVWDAAALLLREHCRCGARAHVTPCLCLGRQPHCSEPAGRGRDLSAARQEALQQTLEAAAKQMSPEERQRPGPGPPPLLAFVRALPLAPALRPRPVAVAPAGGGASEGLDAGRMPGDVSPFIYNPSRVRGAALRPCSALWSRARRRADRCARGVQDKVKAREAGQAEREAAAVWVAGEPASVEVEIRNPTASAIKARACGARACPSRSFAGRGRHAARGARAAGGEADGGGGAHAGRLGRAARPGRPRQGRLEA